MRTRKKLLDLSLTAERILKKELKKAIKLSKSESNKRTKEEMESWVYDIKKELRDLKYDISQI